MLIWTWRLSADLSQRAGHPPEQLKSLHGSLFDIKCSADGCDWVQRGNFEDPFCPSLAPASEDPPPGETLPLLDPYHRIRHIPEEELPKCPKCQVGLQRPAVVWFGESLDATMLTDIEAWMSQGKVVSLPRNYCCPLLGPLLTQTRISCSWWARPPRCGLRRATSPRRDCTERKS